MEWPTKVNSRFIVNSSVFLSLIHRNNHFNLSDSFECWILTEHTAPSPLRHDRFLTALSENLVLSPHSWKNQWGHRWIRPTHGDLERWWSWITDPETHRSTCFHVHNPCTGSFFLMCLNKNWFIYLKTSAFFLYCISLVGCSHLQKVPVCFYHLKSIEIQIVQ